MARFRSVDFSLVMARWSYMDSWYLMARSDFVDVSSSNGSLRLTGCIVRHGSFGRNGLLSKPDSLYEDWMSRLLWLAVLVWRSLTSRLAHAKWVTHHHRLAFTKWLSLF